MPELDHKVIEDVYKAILQDFKKAARAQGRGIEDAEEVATEAITRMLESHQKDPIENPLHWARRTAANLWKDMGRRDSRHVSYDGIEGISVDGQVAGYYGMGTVSGEESLAYQRDTDTLHKSTARKAVKQEMAESVMEYRSPETIAEQRDLLQKIDPQWREHMEEGYDFRSGKKMNRNIRRQIQRRARALLREEPLC